MRTYVYSHTRSRQPHPAPGRPTDSGSVDDDDERRRHHRTTPQTGTTFPHSFLFR